MLLHILKKDLQRKRVMNCIVLLFIILAATFLASSTNNLITITSATDYFLEISKTPDYLMVVANDDGESEIEAFLEKNQYVTEYEVMNSYAVLDDAIEIVKCAADPQKEKFERNNTIALGALPENFLKVFDGNDQPLHLDRGEIAIPMLLANQNQLSVGDVLKITCGKNEIEFTISDIMKDAVFGSEMMGLKRMIVSEEDYADLTAKTQRTHMLLFSVNCSDMDAFEKDFKKNDFQLISSINRSTLDMLYVFDMVIAGVLIIVSICLIIVSLLILRFTIVFTLQEDYKEIGIMKAIGIRDRGIKGIYLVKYLVISLTGAFIGLVLSFPFEKLLLKQTITNMVVKDAESNYLLNVGCAVLIVALVLSFCYLSTGKVRKFSAIEAIRNGSNGERFKAKTVFHLNKRKWITPAFYMACNDVAGNMKRFLVLAVIFCIGTLEIQLPLTAIHTLRDKSIISSFSLQESDLVMDNTNSEQYITQSDDSKLLSDMKNIEEKFAANGLNAQVWVEVGYMVPCYSNDPQQTVQYNIMQLKGNHEDQYDVLEGRIPKLNDEIMITERTAKELQVGIGDSIYLKYPDEAEEYVITGTYQSLMSLGNGFRISQNAFIDNKYLSMVMNMQVQFTHEVEDPKEKAKEVYPDIEIYTTSEYVNNMIGGIMDQLDTIKFLIVCVVIVINVLITILIMKMLITKERGEIAMLKSIGFSNSTLKAWQTMRILLVMICSMVLGVFFMKFLAPIVVTPIFSMMGGTSMKLILKPLEAYVIIPLILLVVTGFAAWLCAWDVNKVDLKEINTLE